MRRRPLLEQVTHPQALSAAWEDVRRAGGAPGADGVGMDAFSARLGVELAELSRALKGGWYTPLPVRRVHIPKPAGGQRVIGVACVRDRIVSRACLRVLGPELERIFLPGSFAYRPRRSARGAALKLSEYLSRGRPWVAALDIRDFFPSIRRELLLSFLKEELRGDPLVGLIGILLESGWVGQGRRGSESVGLEQGHPLSPLLSNLYLHPLDVAWSARGVGWVRYSDNAALACGSREEAQEELSMAREALGRLALELSEAKSEVVDGRLGLCFLGCHVDGRGLGPTTAAVEDLRARLRSLREGAGGGQERTSERLALLRPWALHHQRLDLVPVEDGWTLAAALMLARERGDEGAARALLSRPDAAVSPPELEAIHRAASWLERGDPGRRGSAGLSTSSAEGRAAHLALGGPVRGGVAHPRGPDAHAGEDPTAQGVEELLTRGSYRAAQQRWRQERPEPPRAALDRTDEGEIVVSAEALRLLERRFRGAASHHGRGWCDARGRRGYSLQRRGLDGALWREHLAGQSSLALSLTEGPLVWVAALDVDIQRRVFDGVASDPGALGRELRVAHRSAVELAKAARRLGLPTLLVDSGQKGRHLWLRFEEGLPCADAYRLLMRIQQEAGPHPERLSWEPFPRDSGAEPGPELLVALPLGVHLVSRRRSVLLTEQGEVLRDVEAALRGWGACPPDKVQQALAAPRAGEGAGRSLGDPRLRAVMAGCGVLAELAREAELTHHLGHVERLTLLGTLGHFGEEGRALIHEVIGACSNYDTRVTDRHIAGLKPSPVSCQRIREWLPDVARRCGCRCALTPPRGAYPSPVLWAVEGAHPTLPEGEP